MRWKCQISTRLSTAFLATFLTLPAFGAETVANAVFLVAGRGLADPNFRETVVLVTHPRRGGPWGVIVNRPLEQPLSEVFPDHAALKGATNVLHFGGPVARQSLVVLARAGDPPPGATMFLRDVFTTGDTDWIDGYLRRPEATKGLRVFAGHAGWARGQLQGEIARGGWHVIPADAETLFDKDPAGIWPELIERATTKQTRDEGGRMREEGFLASAQRKSSLIPHPSFFSGFVVSVETRDVGGRP
jgi:putative transcriptional regulator